MIELQMTAGDLTRLRFAYSPVQEALASLNMLYLGQVYPLHRGWAAVARERLRTMDTTVLRAVVPGHRAIISPPLDTSGPATIDFELKLLADWSPDLLRAELESVWQGHAMPEATRQIIADGAAGVRRVAAALGEYWDAALAPHWDQLRAVLEAEIAYRGRRVALGGISALLEDLHPRLRLDGSVIRISKPRRGHIDLGGRGILLIPCVFAGVNIAVDPGGAGPATISYGPRGIGAVWQTDDPRPAGPDVLGAVLGRGRAAVLRAAGLPKSTSELSLELNLAGPTVSVHLATLKACGLVTSWRSGRRVLYQRTPLAARLLAAAWSTAPADVIT